jgi:hypothetical protein
MATTTPNYGWSVPTSSDYVAQGAVAIETLGDSADATLFSVTGGKNVGMVHLNTTTTSAASTVTISNVFTSTYDNYKIFITGVSSTDNALLYQNALAGTPAGGTSYYYGQVYANNTTAPNIYGESAIAHIVCGTSNTTSTVSELTIARPALATSTFMQCQGTKNTTSSWNWQLISGLHTVTTAYDGFTIKTSGGTFTGTIRVYGLRNS